MSQNGTPKPGPLKPPHRRLVVMFDGTGNTRQNMTNVSRMFEAIDDSYPQSYKPIDGSAAKHCPPLQGPACPKIVQCETCNQSMMERVKHEGDDSEAKFRAGVPCGSCQQVVVEPELQPVQLVKYIVGVKKDLKWIIRWLTSQSIGYSLPDKIKEGYAWLCSHYQKDDEVFVFGFSRGAFAARSLVSLLCKCGGVLKKIPNSSTHVDLSFDYKIGDDKDVMEKAYNYYRVCVESLDETNEAKLKYLANQKRIFDDYLRNWNEFTRHEYSISKLEVKVKMLGVWDTIGAVGLSETGLSCIDNSSFSRMQYQFHNESLSSIVENAYHALALDEHREAFKPILWTSRDPPNQNVKQVWFVGSHCNVGGGADLDDTDDPDDLWQYSYVWMQRHAEKHGLRFFWNIEYPATRQANSHLRTRRVSLRETEPSSKYPIVWADNKYKLAKSWWRAWWSAPPFIREIDPILAMLHWSVIDRIHVTEDDLEKAKEYHLVKQMPTVYRPPTFFPNGPSKGRPEWDANWHIETDDVKLCTQWRLPVRPKSKEEEKGKEKEDKKGA